ncbi:uncharacterized protein LOC34621292 [Cyclospora cayetanensis]|uniref:Uncharacterized protein LOC34621292 n=1 Tax=Cyclospora cayetanensis TaxID=88456 RepID=A0A6P6S1V4_9EIME|nr:uncharacterized protein LOC34621292 [Cyclospora cayetanensis]
MDSSATETPLSPVLSQDGPIGSLYSQAEERPPQDGHSLQTPRSVTGLVGIHENTRGQLTPKGTQPQIKQKEAAPRSVEGKPVPSDFVLSADAPPYTPQPLATRQALNAANGSHVLTEQPQPGFIGSFSPIESHLQEKCLHPGFGAHLGPVPMTHSADFGATCRAESAAAAASAGNRKTTTILNSQNAPSNVPLKFCKFLIGEDVAGFLVGRKGVGIEEFQSRNGPGLKVSVSKRGELFPCLLERTATAVGVGDGMARALMEISRVALDRAMHKEEERRIDNGKKICKPKGCFKLVIPEYALTHLFTPSSDGNVPVLEVAKKNGVEILSSAQGGYLHNKIHHLKMKETVLQIIGTADAVPGAVVDISSLYQGDPSLPSYLHLNYSHAHLAATPPPPPTPPPSPALSSSCGLRLSPHFAHPASVLQLTSGQQPLVNSSAWSPRTQPAPLLQALRASANSQGSMICMPSTVGSSENASPAQLPHTERLLASQVQRLQGVGYPASGAGGGVRSGQENAAAEKFAGPLPSLADERLVMELQQHLGAVVAAAAAAGGVPTQQLLTSAPPSSAPNMQPGFLQHLEELQHSLIKQLLQLQQQHSNKLPYRQAETHNSSNALSAPSGPHDVQQLQHQVHMMQLQQQADSHKGNIGGTGASLPGAAQIDEQTKLLIFSQQLQQELQQQQAPQSHLQLPHRLQHTEASSINPRNVPHANPLKNELRNPVAWSEQGRERFQQLQQLQQVQDMAAGDRIPGSALKMQCLEAELLQPHSQELSVQPLSPMPPPQWAPIPQQLPQQQQQLPQQQLPQQQLPQQQLHQQSTHQTDWRISLGSSHCSSSGASTGAPAQLPRQHSHATSMSEAAVPLTVNDLLEMSREAPSVMLHPATMDSALQRVAENMVLPSSREKYDSLAVRTLLEELLKAMNSSPTGEASSTEGQEPPPPTPPLAAKGVTYPAHITSKGQKSLPGNGERVGEAVTEAAANEQQVRDTVWEYGLEAPHANVVMVGNNAHTASISRRKGTDFQQACSGHRCFPKATATATARPGLKQPPKKARHFLVG